MKINLADVVDKLEAATDQWQCWLNTKTGEFFEFRREDMAVAEDLDDISGLDGKTEINGRYNWDKEFVERAMTVLENWGDCVKLPDQYEIHEYNIMENFAEATQNPVKKEKLCRSLHGKGAFQRFKDTLDYSGLTEAYYAFYYLAFVNIAREWCKDNEIEYNEK